MTNSEQLPAKISHASLTVSARQALSGNWGIGALGSLIYLAVALAAGMIPIVGMFIISGPLAVGFAFFTLKISRENNADVEHIFSGFQQFGQALIAYLLYLIAVMAGFILLVIPGIIISLGLSQTFFIMADKPNISGVDALRESWDIMDGHKANYFVFSLRFIGWSILCILTLFIGYFWLFPYMQVSYAKFYDMVKTGRHPDDLDGNISKHLLEDELI